MNLEEFTTGRTRPAVCLCCGAEYTQVELSTRLYAASSHLASRTGLATSAMERQIPDGWVPLFCKPCERYDLARTAELEQFEKPEGRQMGVIQRDRPHRKEQRACCDARLRVVASEAAD